ncbi:uncharacterized protein TM35_000461710 [Trypanosoma theileri]|uniref:Sugar phosphate transporter domain-containing protein n=1 Tax=Trypanosoma theileri TaxID=67003 RepID=A0A1X0NHW2_9TRYP|nr:uncharacterized protein TM35_000461710 [Trypanosoma theileri]ORC84352.1 hypothetical protein TM35_000461710 [Trypanosoma theileri]
MFLWSLGLCAVVLVWCISVLWCDVQSASFLQEKGSIMEVVFFTNFFACIVTTAACLLLRVTSWSDLKYIAVSLYENTLTWRLLLSVACVNVLALSLMFSSFTLAGMTHAYAVKTTEPLLMCLLSTECMQRGIRRILDKGRTGKNLHGEEEDYPISTKIITIDTWFSVMLVCIGAFLTSSSLKRTTTDHSLSLTTLMFAYCLIFASNAALALRTTLMKPLLHLVPDCGVVLASCAIHIFMSLLGSLILMVPTFLNKGKYIVEYDKETWKRIAVIGASYGVYQFCNGMVLFNVIPLAYSILKQIRVVIIFFFSAYYFGKEFESVLQLAVGLTFLAIGSYRYAAH